MSCKRGQKQPILSPMKKSVQKNTRRTNLEVIQSYFRGELREVHLSDENKRYLKMYRHCYSMLLDVKSHKYIMRTLADEFELSERQSYRVLDDAKQIYSDVRKADKDINQHIAIEMAKKAFRRAKQSNSTRDMVEATKAFIKATGLDKDNVELPDFERLQPSLLVAVLPEGLKESIQDLLSEPAIDLNKAPKTIEIEHEEITDANTESTAQTGD